MPLTYPSLTGSAQQMNEVMTKMSQTAEEILVVALISENIKNILEDILRKIELLIEKSHNPSAQDIALANAIGEIEGERLPSAIIDNKVDLKIVANELKSSKNPLMAEENSGYGDHKALQKAIRDVHDRTRGFSDEATKVGHPHVIASLEDTRSKIKELLNGIVKLEEIGKIVRIIQELARSRKYSLALAILEGTIKYEEGALTQKMTEDMGNMEDMSIPCLEKDMGNIWEVVGKMERLVTQTPIGAEVIRNKEVLKNSERRGPIQLLRYLDILALAMHHARCTSEDENQDNIKFLNSAEIVALTGRSKEIQGAVKAIYYKLSKNHPVTKISVQGDLRAAFQIEIGGLLLQMMKNVGLRLLLKPE